jgi:hypothetical protein
MAGAFLQEDVIRPSKDPKVGETPEALSLRFNCKNGPINSGSDTPRSSVSLLPGASTRSCDSGLRCTFVHSRPDGLDCAYKCLFADRLAQEIQRTRLGSPSLLIVTRVRGDENDRNRGSDFPARAHARAPHATPSTY